MSTSLTCNTLNTLLVQLKISLVISINSPALTSFSWKSVVNSTTKSTRLCFSSNNPNLIACSGLLTNGYVKLNLLSGSSSFKSAPGVNALT